MMTKKCRSYLSKQLSVHLVESRPLCALDNMTES